MYCKLCGTHLYQEITFYSLFKFNYFLHEKCIEKINRNIDYIVFPFLDKLVYRDYLFDEVHEEADTDFLYEKYSVLLYEKMLKNNEWSIVIFIDGKLNKETAILITKLADIAILICSIFNENFL